MVKASKNCPARRLDLSDDQWKVRIYTMLAFCVSVHVATFALLIAKLVFN